MGLNPSLLYVYCKTLNLGLEILKGVFKPLNTLIYLTPLFLKGWLKIGVTRRKIRLIDGNAKCSYLKKINL